MRLKKQSMRQLKDAALQDRQPAPDPGRDAILRDIDALKQAQAKPQYYRGALIKPR